jgi:hypothetical protein
MYFAAFAAALTANAFLLSGFESDEPHFGHRVELSATPGPQNIINSPSKPHERHLHRRQTVIP